MSLMSYFAAEREIKEWGEASFFDAALFLGLVLGMLAALVIRWHQEKSGDFFGPPLGKTVLLVMGIFVAGIFLPFALFFAGSVVWGTLK